MQPPPESDRPIDRLIAVMAILRSAEGCPWDRKQSLASLKPYLIEEAYEVLDAIDSGDPEKHREELGDLLLQVVFQSQLQAENGVFQFEDVADAIVQKLIRRHPHVFGDVQAEDAETVLQNWDAIKKVERGAAGKSNPSVLDEMPKAMPALMKAQEVQKRVARVGFDWKDPAPVLDKIEEELNEYREALASGDLCAQHDELGDLLFSVVNLARWQGSQAEEALQSTIHKFIRRFREVEKRAERQGDVLSALSLDAMEALWQEVKKDE